MQAKQHRSPVDRTSNYHEALGDLSRSHGVPIDLLLEEWAERAAVREYLGGVSRDEAEFLAMDDVRSRFRHPLLSPTTNPCSECGRESCEGTHVQR